MEIEKLRFSRQIWPGIIHMLRPNVPYVCIYIQCALYYALKVCTLLVKKKYTLLSVYRKSRQALGHTITSHN